MIDTPITVRWDRLDGSPVELRSIMAERRDNWLYLVGGPTGYESMCPTDPRAMQAIADGQDWIACFGTPGRWPRCEVPFDELAQAVAKLW